ncbi:MAG: biotin-dependent carboxyltransferase family protein [Sporolactobacillus sp.]
MASIRCIKPGLLTTVQDKGRQAYQSMGISASGAMDQYAMRVGNLLVGNPDDAAVLEAAMIGPQIEINYDGCAAITGADFSPELNGAAIDMWKAIYVRRGDRLSFGAPVSGCLTYIAFSGGLSVPSVLGSCATFMRGGYGGVEGRMLREGDCIDVLPPRIPPERLIHKKLAQHYVVNYEEDVTVRFIWGPQEDRFTDEARERFITSPYTVSMQSDRMGYRLKGERLMHRASADILSDYICPGAVQVPGDGQPIVLMADCQMTGGYTKIAVVIDYDLPRVAQCKPGSTIHFKPIDVKHAQDLIRKRETFFKILRKGIERLI